MQVRAGWNTEYGRDKFDVTMEEADLHRVLIEYGIPVEVANTFPATIVFKIMWVEAEIFSQATLARKADSKALREAAAAEVASRKAERDRLLAPYIPAKAAT